MSDIMMVEQKMFICGTAKTKHSTYATDIPSIVLLLIPPFHRCLIAHKLYAYSIYFIVILTDELHYYSVIDKV